MAILETTRGAREESSLRKEIVTYERARGVSTWTEYYDTDNALIRRDIHFRAYSAQELSDRVLKGDSPK